MKCVYCGKEFEPNSNVQKYCSAECREKAYATVEGKTKICPCCGTEFKPRYPIQKYCSRQCGRRAGDAREYERRKNGYVPEPVKLIVWSPARRKCLNCGAEFVEHFSGDKFCSDDCCWNYYRYEIKLAIYKVLKDKLLCK
ncbi:MAG: hypothetical protein IJK81_00525 [Selenomonadaceae bacterium]|nr:hypothetical protein [Selenomonadaceae bacterium]